MKQVTTRFISISCLLLSLNLSAQTQVARMDPRDFLSHNHPVDRERYRIQPDANELIFFMNILFSGYKFIFSSQDNSSCTFHPSCSVYAVESMRQLGLVRGALAAFDRLSRCNGLSPEWYKIDRKTGLLIDPVE